MPPSAEFLAVAWRLPAQSHQQVVYRTLEVRIIFEDKDLPVVYAYVTI
jgi:hypothetical protein